MYWFVIYAAGSRSRARADAVNVDPPGSASWLECASPAGRGSDPEASSVRRYTALLSDGEWTELCEEISLDLESACRDSQRCSVCEAGPLPVAMLHERPVQLPGMSASLVDIQEGVVGPLPVIALDLPGAPVTPGAAARLEVGLCVAPLPESEEEREHCRALYAAAAFNVGGEEAELRCPDCASPELRWLGGPDSEQQMGCGNCGARLPRESAFLRLGDCEAILTAERSPGLAVMCAEGHSP